MAKLKTQPNDASVNAFLDDVEAEDPQKGADCRMLIKIMQRATGEPPKMWGKSMVGFGSYHYKYESGREGDWFLTGFSPRKRELSLYVMPGFDHFDQLMSHLGKHKTGKSCLYIKQLGDVDLDVLEQLVAESVEHMRQQYS
ncbi:DUF1801 domain-containing protein [Wenzhouxiangella sp. XN201]|uniref:DUF1801 domain-containing protein n=1 Tax=Wenzhouxiangella sp. XN201 TaxID=2710755 RepID=UPI0013C6FC4A|nr:DUF1801 domain-containing protein [Wenzhouxiangella sp. XN201]NEZ04939.1 DUF1801 domain-containing protein [Wenzhouxiangella sp. XN201]